jgi:hypothetical protein
MGLTDQATGDGERSRDIARSWKRSLPFCKLGGSELCLTIVGTPPWGPLHEGMRFSTSIHTEMAIQLAALWTAVCSTAQFVLGCLPPKVFRLDVVG